MKRLGYTRYVAQGGDWGSPISSAMARQAPAGLLGIHINLPATVPPEVAAVLASGAPAPAGLSEKERAAFDSLDTFYKKYRAYGAMMGTRPQVIGQALTDSPAGLAVFMYDYNNGEPERLLTKDDFLDNVTLYWLTNSATSSARLYWETSGQSVLLAAAQKTAEISLPVAITVFPEEVYRAPETWARRAYRNLIYFHEVDKGGHFAAWEQPELFRPNSAPRSDHFGRHTDHEISTGQGGLHENDSNPGGSGADRRKRLGTERGAVAAAGSHAHRSAAARSGRLGTRGDPGARRFRSRGGVSAAQPSRRRDRLRHRRLAGVSARGQAAGDAQGRRGLCSSRPERSTRRRMSAAATRRSLPLISSKKASRSSHSVR